VNYCKCRDCFGTGRKISVYSGDVAYKCFKCDGTGNAMVDGPAEA
jgi:predicted SprT family Zn-dependent metalloprotease